MKATFEFWKEDTFRVPYFALEKWLNSCFITMAHRHPLLPWKQLLLPASALNIPLTDHPSSGHVVLGVLWQQLAALVVCCHWLAPYVKVFLTQVFRPWSQRKVPWRRRKLKMYQLLTKCSVHVAELRNALQSSCSLTLCVHNKWCYWTNTCTQHSSPKAIWGRNHTLALDPVLYVSFRLETRP